MEDNKQIKFDIVNPKDIRESVINTLLLMIEDLVLTENMCEKTKGDLLYINDQIERVKNLLDSMKYNFVKCMEE